MYLRSNNKVIYDTSGFCFYMSKDRLFNLVTYHIKDPHPPLGLKLLGSGSWVHEGLGMSRGIRNYRLQEVAGHTMEDLPDGK